MANRFWVGGAASWNATAGTKWATTSGGAGGAAVPTASDDVFLDGASGAVVVTVSANQPCRSLDCSGFTGTLTINSGITLSVGTSSTGPLGLAVKLVSGMAVGGTGSLKLASTTTGNTVTWGGRNPAWAVNFNGAGGGWTLQDTFTITGTLNHVLGTLDTNGQAVTAANLATAGGVGTSVLTLGSSTVTLTGTGNAWLATSATLYTLNAGTSTIVISNASATAKTFAGLGLTYNNLSITAAGNCTITGANTFANLTRTGVNADDGLTLPVGITTVSTALTLTGNAANKRLIIQSASGASAGTIALGAAGTASLTDVTFLDITVTGTNAPVSGTRVGQGPNCSGITFASPRTLYWVGGTGSWSDSTNHWATSSNGAGGLTNFPLPQDTTIFDANSITSDGSTVTMDRVTLGNTWDCSALAHTVTFAMTVIFYTLYGDLKWSVYATSTTSSVLFPYAPSQAISVWCNGGNLGTISIAQNRSDITLTLQDNFAANTSFSPANFNANNFNVSATKISSSSVFACTCTMGSGTWTVSDPSTPWDFSAASGITVAPGTSTIVIADVSSSTKTFAGGGKTYGKLTFRNAGSGGLTITGANSFSDTNISGTVAFTLTLPAAATTTFTGALALRGLASNLLSLVSSSAGSAATISKTSGRVICDYLSLKDSTATGGAIFYAGSHTTNVSGNTGWTFKDERQLISARSAASARTAASARAAASARTVVRS